MAKALTARSVDQQKPDPESRIEVPDGLLTGLYLVVQPSGSKSWAVRYRYGDDSRKLTLGKYPALDLGEARKAAKAALQAVADGGDPAQQKRVAKEDAKAGRDLFETLFDEFLRRHAKKLRSAGEIERTGRLHLLPRWSGRRVQDIARRDIIQMLDELQDSGMAVGANRVLGLARKFFNWCVERDIIDISPAAGVKPPAKELSRERVLSDDEIRLLWAATEKVGYPFGPMVRLLLVTGQRRNEVAGLPWSELKLDQRVWNLPAARSKNGRANDVHLSDLATQTIESLPKIAGTRRLLFTTTGETPVSGFSRAKAILDKAMVIEGEGEEIPHWQLHDIRRTVATGMQRLGIPPHVAEAVLNHKSGTIRGVAAVYQRHDYVDEKRRALDAWGRMLSAIVEGRADNVVELHTAEA